MSTAGKVLSVFVLLAVIGWTVLASGVAQLNYNGNIQLQKLIDNVAKLQEDIDKTRAEFVVLRDKTTLDQEHLDRQLAVLHATQNDVERARSQIIDTLSGLKYQLESVQATIQSAQATFENRSNEAKEEEKALADARKLVKTLDGENTELLAKLQGLREQFKSTYGSNVELVRTRK